jgi:hypothetical protein
MEGRTDVSTEHPKTPAVDANPGPMRGFWANFIKGLTAGGMFIGGVLPGPSVPTTDMGSDWESIGRDIRTTLKRYAARDE